jgi:hypothetical protein
MRRLLVLALSISFAACAGGTDGASDSAAGMADADPDRATTGGGVPAGYTARADREGTDLSTLQYAARGDDAWEITTGPAHIVWAAGDSASGSYTVRAEFEQLEAPAHPEAFGIFVGGQDLEGPEQRYTYFIVRGTGEYLVRVREGDDTRNVVDWTKSDAVAAQDSSGRASYELAVQVGADSVTFLVGDERVAAVAKSAVPTEGTAGLRVNHNLHVSTGPVEIVRQ